MASPQLENGYATIANEILESLARIRIPGEARQVLDVIIRKTYGFHKKKDRIALSQFAKATGLDGKSVCRALKRLNEMKLIEITGEYNGNSYSIQKDHEKWVEVTKSPLAKLPLAKPPKKAVAKLPLTKDIYITKDNKHMLSRKKPQKIEKNLDASVYTEIYRVLDSFEAVNRHWHTLHEQPKQYDATMRMIKIHGIEQVMKVIAVLPKTNEVEFFPRIFTPVQLEEKWESLHHAWKDAVRKKIKSIPKVLFS